MILTSLPGPVSVLITSPVTASHTRTILSSLPLTIRDPSGLNDTEVIYSENIQVKKRQKAGIVHRSTTFFLKPKILSKNERIEKALREAVSSGLERKGG